MAYEYILVEKESGVAILTMNRPAQLNAMNRQLSSELHDAVTQMVADDEVGCIVITGRGNVHLRRAAISMSNARTISPSPKRNWMHAAPSEPRQLSDQRLPQTNDRHDERPGLRGGRSFSVVAGYADRL